MPFVAGEGPPQSLEFAKKYQERFKEAPDLHAALAYDGLRLLFEAMRRAKSFQSAKILEELANTDRANFETLSGTLTFNRYHAARRPLYVAQVEDGQLRNSKLFPAEEK